MTGRSNIVIDGTVVNGNLVTMAHTYIAVSRALTDLAESGHESIWVPVKGVADDDARVVRLIRLHRASSVNVTLVEEDGTSSDILDELSDTSVAFFEKYGRGDTE